MTIWPSNLAFEWPFLLILLPMPLMLAWFRGPRNRPAAAPALPPRLAAALTAAGARPSAVARRLPLILLWIGWISLVVAIARPTWLGEAEISAASGRALMLVIDLSSSMEREDFSLDGESLDRLEAVKRVAQDFIGQRRGDRIGLVLFGEEAFVASPLTLDVSAVSASLAEAAIGMAGRSTAIGEALGLAIVRLRGEPAREKVVILLSDGTNNAGSAEPEEAAELAASQGVRVHTIALASDAVSDNVAAAADLDEATLKAVADRSGGQFFRARSLAELASVYETIERIDPAEAAAPPLLPRRDVRNLFVLAALLSLLGLAFSGARA